MSEQQTALPMECPPIPSAVVAAAGPTHDRAESPSRALEAVKWMFSFPAMLAVALIGRLFYEARIFQADPDTWWHIKVGLDILNTHHWPTVDPYSFTAANTPWIAYEWLGEVALALASKAGGVYGLAVFRFVITGLTLLALYYLGTVRSKNCKAGFVPAGLMASLVLLSFTLRPQMFGYLFLVLLLIALEWFRRGVTWPIWTLPVMFLLWVNTHGSFIVGIGVLGVYLCGGLKSFQIGSVEAIAWTPKQRMQLETTLLLSLASLCITPYGTELAVYPFDIMLNQPLNIQSVLEWKPMPFDETGGKLFLLVVTVLVAAQLFFRMVWRVEELLLVFLGTVMACLHVRMILIFIPFVAPIFATVAARLLPPYQRAKEHYWLNAVIMAGVIAAIVHYVPSRESIDKKVASQFPVQAVAYLNSHDVPGPMLNNYGFGGYLVGEGRKTFIDGRADIFERSGVLNDYVTFLGLRPGGLTVLDRYNVRSCLLLKDEPLATVLTSLPGWRRVYVDDTAALFVRNEDAGKLAAGTASPGSR